MADLIFPTESDINGGTTNQGRAFTEAMWYSFFKDGQSGKEGSNLWGCNFVRYGLSYDSAVGLVATFLAGECIVNGYYCEIDSKDITLPASSTSRIFLQLTATGGYVDGAELIYQDASSTTVPTRAVQLYEITTGTATVTGSTDRRPLSPSWAAGSYTGSVSSQGVFVGFYPSLLLIKKSTTDLLGISFPYTGGVISFYMTSAPLIATHTQIAFQNYGFSVTNGVPMSDTGVTYYYYAKR